jgi:hypothetical protein
MLIMSGGDLGPSILPSAQALSMIHTAFSDLEKAKDSFPARGG